MKKTTIVVALMLIAKITIAIQEPQRSELINAFMES